MESILSALKQGHAVVACFTLFVLALIGVWEIYSNFNEEKDDNLGFIMYRWSDKFYYLLFFWGTAGGHLFFGSSNIVISSYVSILFVVIVTAILMIFDFRKKRSYIDNYKKVIALLIGFLTGHFLWSMNGII